MSCGICKHFCRWEPEQSHAPGQGHCTAPVPASVILGTKKDGGMHETDGDGCRAFDQMEVEGG